MFRILFRLEAIFLQGLQNTKCGEENHYEFPSHSGESYGFLTEKGVFSNFLYSIHV